MKTCVLNLQNNPNLNPVLTHLALSLIAKYTFNKQVYRQRSNPQIIYFVGTIHQEDKIQRIYNVILNRLTRKMLIAVLDEIEVYGLVISRKQIEGAFKAIQAA
jgi:hypothetical protein